MKNKICKIIISFVVISLIIGIVNVSAIDINSYSTDVKVYYNGNDIYKDSDYKPIIINDRTMVRLVPIFEAMGWKDSWDERTQSVIFYNVSDPTNNPYIYKFYKDENFIEYGFENEPMRTNIDVPATIYDDVFYVPLRAFCEAVGIEIEWYNSNRTVYISSELTTVSEQKQEHFDGSNFMGEWYYTIYSDPQYKEDFHKIEIVPYEDNKAKVIWSDGTSDIIEFVSENEAIGAYGEISKARYVVKPIDGVEHFNVDVADGGPIFQMGAGGYRVVPDLYK